MLGIIILTAFEACGLVQAFTLMKRRNRAVRVWLGLTMGLMEMMWLPSLFAFLLDFTLPAQVCALAAAMLLCVPCLFIGRGHESAPEREIPWKLLLIVLIPVAVLCGYLQYTHTLRPEGGALYVGQSTYGDLCMHLSFATGLIGQSYPPTYTLLPGSILGYPFLVDALSSTMLIFGTPLSLSFVIPGTLMCALVFGGIYLFTYEITKRKGAAVLAIVLLLFSGGLGFLRTLDMAPATEFAELKNALDGYYQAPANQPDYNLRWVNALCDLLIPQRTLLAGWVTLIPALYLLYTAMKSRRTADFIALGLWAGPMVMIHTHSFLGLGAISLGAMGDTLIRDKKHRRTQLLNFLLYGSIAVILALPQLMVWTFPQTFKGGSLRFLFNWVNNNGRGGLIDGYFWFWLKNVGLMFLLFPVAVLSSSDRRVKALGLGSLITYILAETVLFQPNVYDNNKLFAAAYLCMLPVGCGLLCDLWDRMSGIRGRCVLAAAFLFACTASGAISIVREVKSNYMEFGPTQVEAAEYIKENTFEDALFVTANNHNNTVASLTGRKIVCGSSLYLYYHGLDYQQQDADAILMLAFPDKCEELFVSYSVDYIYLSDYEKNTYQVWNGFVKNASIPVNTLSNYTSMSADTQKIADCFPLVYEAGNGYDSVKIYAVSERAQALAFQNTGDKEQ